MASTSGTDSATTMPVRQPSDEEADEQHDASASTKEWTNSSTAWSTTTRLIGDLLEIEALRHARP